MAIYYALGNALVTEEEIQEKRPQLEEMDDGPVTTALEFSTGVLSADTAFASMPVGDGAIAEFVPVAPGSPMTIELRHVYTGEYPHTSLFDKSKDMLVSSAMKGLAVYQAQPRAVNFMKKSVEAKTDVSHVAATQAGTPLIFYTPALVRKNSVVTIEFGFDEFPNEVFDLVGNALKAIGGIPLFVAASAYLLAGSVVTKLAGKVGSLLFDREPVYAATEGINFERPGAAIAQADFRLIVEDDVPAEWLKRHQLNSAGRLLDMAGNQYAGDIPYAVISLDGREMDEYKDFTATAATAASLDRFYNIKEGQEQSLAPLVDALKLYNDYTFRQKADGLQQQIDATEDAAKRAALTKEREALVKNIVNDLLKP